MSGGGNLKTFLLLTLWLSLLPHIWYIIKEGSQCEASLPSIHVQLSDKTERKIFMRDLSSFVGYFSKKSLNFWLWNSEKMQFHLKTKDGDQDRWRRKRWFVPSRNNGWAHPPLLPVTILLRPLTLPKTQRSFSKQTWSSDDPHLWKHSAWEKSNKSRQWNYFNHSSS